MCLGMSCLASCLSCVVSSCASCYPVALSCHLLCSGFLFCFLFYVSVFLFLFLCFCFLFCLLGCFFLFSVSLSGLSSLSFRPVSCFMYFWFLFRLLSFSVCVICCLFPGFCWFVLFLFMFSVFLCAVFCFFFWFLFCFLPKFLFKDVISLIGVTLAKFVVSFCVLCYLLALSCYVLCVCDCLVLRSMFRLVSPFSCCVSCARFLHGVARRVYYISSNAQYAKRDAKQNTAQTTYHTVSCRRRYRDIIRCVHCVNISSLQEARIN